MKHEDVHANILKEATMELVTAVKGRRSIRKYKQVDVPRNLIAELLAEASWSPSWGNTQPWEFYVLLPRQINIAIMVLM